MTLICRKCDSALKEKDLSFLGVFNGQVIHRVHHGDCAIYAADEKGDVWTPPRGPD